MPYSVAVSVQSIERRPNKAAGIFISSDNGINGKTFLTMLNNVEEKKYTNTNGNILHFSFIVTVIPKQDEGSTSNRANGEKATTLWYMHMNCINTVDDQ